MSIQRTINLFRNTVLPATLNSYAVVFFLNNRMFAAVILFVSFFNFFAGLSGLIAAVVSDLIAHAMGFDKTLIKNGIYSFNALLIGIGMGTFFDPGWVFFSLLLIATSCYRPLTASKSQNSVRSRLRWVFRSGNLSLSGKRKSKILEKNS